MVEPCDSIGSPASHQQLVVVQAIVHTDNGPNNKVVKIPPYVPVFLKRDGKYKIMQTDGIAHVSLLGTPRDFFGISTELFVAHHSRGESSNHMPVAISGLQRQTRRFRLQEVNHNSGLVHVRLVNK